MARCNFVRTRLNARPPWPFSIIDRDLANRRHIADRFSFDLSEPATVNTSIGFTCKRF